MTFDELLDKACTTAGLPEMAKMQLPNSLSAETKEMVLKLCPEELGRVLNDAIDAVNHGSVETIDKLVIEHIKNSKDFLRMSTAKTRGDKKHG